MALPGIDGICDYDSPYRKYIEEEQYIPDIDNQYIVVYQTNGKVYKEVFTVFDGDDLNKVFSNALEFARTHDTILFYAELCTEFYHPKTGESVETPLDSPYVKHYYDQPVQPYQKMEWFKSIETDELPF